MRDDNRDDLDFAPGDSFDVSDENPIFLSNLLRALQREMRAGFEMLREEMRHDHRIRETNEDRITDLEQRVAAREQPLRKARK